MHQRAKRLAQQINADHNPIVTTQAVLLEIGNALSKSKYRRRCIDLLESFDNDPNTTVISVTDELFDSAFELFKNRTDKEWGLVDCVSFVVMREHGINDALTADEHFVQAGFRALLRED